MSEEIQTYETNAFRLAAFLIVRGHALLHGESVESVAVNGRGEAVFVFADPEGVVRREAASYPDSECLRYDGACRATNELARAVVGRRRKKR